MEMYSLMIKNGRLMDKSSGEDRVADIALDKGRIAGIGHFADCEAAAVIDASGCIVTPGLVDMHVHLYPLLPSGIPAEAVCFATGVTTAVDAGSSGCATYPFFSPVYPYVAASHQGVSERLDGGYLRASHA